MTFHFPIILSKKNRLAEQIDFTGLTADTGIDKYSIFMDTDLDQISWHKGPEKNKINK